MNNNEARVIGTFLVWLALTVILVTAMVSHVTINGDYLLGGTVVLLIAGSITTRAIWRSGDGDHSAIQSAEKSKRRTKLDRMLARLSDDELDDLRTRLMSESDGEAVSLEELLAERD